jgi:HAD superfamily hydrolase (TIGR01509 family)
MNQALLFDFNGVLVDDEEQHFQSLRAVLADAGIALSREAYWTDFLGFDDRMCFVAAFERAGRTLAAGGVEPLIAAKSRTYERLIDAELVLVAGAAEFVARAARRFRLGLVSGALRREIEHVLGRARLREHFEVVVAAEDVAACKPDPRGYRAARDALAARGPVPAGRCVVLEDSLPGLLAARGAGMPCVMLATSHPRHALNGADLVWDSFVGHDPSELEALLPA